MAALGTFEVFGARPFAAMSEQFLTVGADARSLTASLQETAASLRTNATDGAAVAGNLRTLATQLDELGAGLGEPAGDGTTPGPGAGRGAAAALAVARLLLLGILAWLAVAAIGSAWLGWRLFRGVTA